MARNRNGEKMRIVIAGLAGAALALTAFSRPGLAGEVSISGFGGGTFNLSVTTLAERRWQAVVRQQYDFSCGSAAVATLLTYHYDWPIDEVSVFEAMYGYGDQEAIRTQGFSMLDMRNYLRSVGFRTDGVRASLDVLAQIGVPVITLITTRGYMHFVVIKGITPRDVIVGDPARGMLSMPRHEFEEAWNGTVLMVRSRADQGREAFNNQRDRNAAPLAPLTDAVLQETISTFSMMLPARGEFY